MMHGLLAKDGSKAVFLASGDNPTPFGILFEQDQTQPSQAAMTALAAIMMEPQQGGAAFDSIQPAGFTFFGQFVDHDITLMTGAPEKP